MDISFNGTVGVCGELEPYLGLLRRQVCVFAPPPVFRQLGDSERAAIPARSGSLSSFFFYTSLEGLMTVCKLFLEDFQVSVQSSLPPPSHESTLRLHPPEKGPL